MNAVMRVVEAEEDHGVAGVLTPKQAAFVKAYVENGGVATKAAELAGYAEPRSSAWGLTRLPHVQAAIRAETERMVQGAGAKAVGWMVKALDDAKLPGAVRFQSAKWLAEAAGHGLAAQRAALGLPAADKPLTEMTLDELDAFISAGKQGIERLKAERERTIEGQAVDVRNDARKDAGEDGASA